MDRLSRTTLPAKAAALLALVAAAAMLSACGADDATTVTGLDRGGERVRSERVAGDPSTSGTVDSQPVVAAEVPQAPPVATQAPVIQPPVTAQQTPIIPPAPVVVPPAPVPSPAPPPATTPNPAPAAPPAQSIQTSAPTAPINTGHVSLSWTPPTENIDGSSLSNLAGYRVYFGSRSDALTQMVQIANPGLTAYVLENLPTGTTYFAIAAYNTAGEESALSGVGSKTII